MITINGEKTLKTFLMQFPQVGSLDGAHTAVNRPICGCIMVGKGTIPSPETSWKILGREMKWNLWEHQRIHNDEKL